MMLNFVLRRAEPHISLWWNADRRSRHGICQHNYIANGYHVQSNRIGGLCFDVIRPTEFTNIIEFMQAQRKGH
jgi:hypothetical protein